MGKDMKYYKVVNLTADRGDLNNCCELKHIKIEYNLITIT